MALLIDGYNLLHVTGIVGRPGSGLHGSREALLRFLAGKIDPKELPATTIVFDAAEAPSGLPRTVMHEGMTIHYASDYDSADALIEELIAAYNVPRSLLVVSSDHRIQRAAHRRRAPFVDSDVWMADLGRRRPGARGDGGESTARRTGALTAEEVAYWTDEFADAPSDESPKKGGKAKKRTSEGGFNAENPFPPGYGEDLLDESR